MSRTVTIPRTLFPAQREIYDCPTQFTVAVCGRRWGKSRVAADRLIDHAIEYGQDRNPQDVWRWVVPYYKNAKVAEAEIARELPAELVTRRNKSDHEWELVNGAIIDMRTADNPDTMLGQSHPVLIIEEASRISEAVWRETLLPTLLDVQGKVLFIFTPKGKTHWTYQQYLKGLDPEEPRYASFQFPSWTSPRIKEKDVDELADDLGGRDSLAFRQEVGAEFLEEAASVFRNHRQLANKPPQIAHIERNYVLGVDLAKTEDWTVITVIDDAHNVVYWDRFKAADWTVQCARILSVASDYRAWIYPDATGLGDPIVDFLKARGGIVKPYKFTNETKQVLINGLVLAIDSGEIGLPQNNEVLLGEMDIFEFHITGSGRAKYSAPTGFHDDAVVSLALAEYGYQQRFAKGNVWIA